MLCRLLDEWKKVRAARERLEAEGLAQIRDDPHAQGFLRETIRAAERLLDAREEYLVSVAAERLLEEVLHSVRTP